MPPRNPFQVGKPVTPEQFVGRWPLIEQMSRKLIQDDGPSYAVIGGRRIGKSSLLTVLHHQLRLPEMQTAGDWVPFPIYFDFKEGSYESAGAVLARLLTEVRRYTDQTVRRPAPNAWSPLIQLDKPWFVELAAKPELNLAELVDCLAEILELLPSPQGDVRLVLLFDEMDELVKDEWVGVLFNQFRSLIYQSDLSERVAMVLAGSERFLIGSEGSPFWNILTLQYLDAFDKGAVNELAARDDALSPQIIDSVVANSGGHPFLAQYLLYHAWEEQHTPTGQETQLDVQMIERLASRFRHEEARHLEGWANAVGLVGLLAYDILLRRADWIAEEELLATLKESSLPIARSLHALCYNGLAIHDGHYMRYKIAGNLFRSWFADNRTRLLTKTVIGHNAMASRYDLDTARSSQQTDSGSTASSVGSAPSVPPDNARLALIDLRNVLTDLYGDEASIRRVTADAGIDAGRIVFGNGATNMWHAVLTEAENAGVVSAIIAIAQREYGGNKLLQAAVEAYQPMTFIETSRLVCTGV